MIVITVAAMIGGFAAGIFALPLGVLPAMILASLAGSGSAGFAGFIVMARRGEDWATGFDRYELEQQTDKNVTALRELVARGRTPDEKEYSKSKSNRAA